jgi:hypothetical protein
MVGEPAQPFDVAELSTVEPTPPVMIEENRLIVTALAELGRLIAERPLGTQGLDF